MTILRHIPAAIGLAVSLASAAFADDRLATAARAGDTSQIEILIASSVDVNSRDSNSMTPLAAAAFNNQALAASMLLRFGARHGGNDELPGFSPLRIALSRNAVSVVRVLLEAGANVTDRRVFGASQVGDTALMEAVSWSYHYKDNSSVALLLRHGADPNERNMEPYDVDRASRGGMWLGHTPLTFAAEHGLEATVELLLHYGADPTLTRTDGTTAIALALANHHTRIARVLRAAAKRKNAS